MCLKRFVSVFLLLLLFVPVSTFSQDSEIITSLQELQMDYQTATEKLNILSIQSEVDLMALTQLLPQLQREVTILQQEVEKLIVESEKLNQDSEQLTTQLQELNGEILKLSESLVDLGTQITSLENSLQSYKTRDIVSLSIGIAAIVGVIILLFKK